MDLKVTFPDLGLFRQKSLCWTQTPVWSAHNTMLSNCYKSHLPEYPATTLEFEDIVYSW